MAQLKIQLSIEHTLYSSERKVGQSEAVYMATSIVTLTLSDKADEWTLRSDKDLMKSSVLNLRIAHKICGFHCRNPQEIWGLH